MSTIIKKHTGLVALTAKDTGYTEALSPSFDPITINDMIKDIDALDEESHEQIYLLLRGFKPAGFFTTDRGGGGTHFDRSLLTERQSQELYHTVQLCKENIKRKHILDNAKSEHEIAMSVLTNNIGKKTLI